MRFFFSTWLESGQRTTLDRRKVTSRLISFAFFRAASPSKWGEYMDKTNVTGLEVMLDSGAFSAWTAGKVITLDEYTAFVLGNQGVFDYVINLDVIPGRKGVPPTQADIDYAAEAGWENFVELSKRLAAIGVKPIHVYHQGENIKVLKRIMDASEYFGLSPRKDQTQELKMKWLDEIMPTLVDDKGWPLRKFHGLGETSEDIMSRYPWYSVDSTSWVLTGRFGSCYIPLNGTTHKINFSAESPKAKEYGRHIDTYSKPERAAVERYLESIGVKGGIRVLRDNFDANAATGDEDNTAYVMRDEVNIQYFLDYEKNRQPRPWKRAFGGGFGL